MKPGFPAIASKDLVERLFKVAGLPTYRIIDAEGCRSSLCWTDTSCLIRSVSASGVRAIRFLLGSLTITVSRPNAALLDRAYRNVTKARLWLDICAYNLS